mgnify:CR=1 FL=1
MSSVTTPTHAGTPSPARTLVHFVARLAHCGLRAADGSFSTPPHDEAHEPSGAGLHRTRHRSARYTIVDVAAPVEKVCPPKTHIVPRWSEAAACRARASGREQSLHVCSSGATCAAAPPPGGGSLSSHRSCRSSLAASIPPKIHTVRECAHTTECACRAGIGVAPAGAEIATRPFQLVTGRRWIGTAFGGARGRTDVPRIVDWYMDGKINIDALITHTMPLEQINDGFELMAQGTSIRGVVLF